MEIIEYVRTHSGKLKGKPRHRKLVQRLLNQPKLIGINNVIEAYPEVTIRNKEMSTEADIIYFCPKEMYIIEVKTKKDSTRTNRHSGIAQLRRAYNIILKRFNISARMIEVVERGKRKPRYRKIKQPIEDILKEFRFP